MYWAHAPCPPTPSAPRVPAALAPCVNHVVQCPVCVQFPVPTRARARRGRGRGGRFVAFGMGATSFVGAVRLKRPATLAGYRAWVAGGGDACSLVGGEEVDEGERGLQDELRAWDDLTEVLMVGLRMRQGLALDGTPPPRPSAAPLRCAPPPRPSAAPRLAARAQGAACAALTARGAGVGRAAREVSGGGGRARAGGTAASSRPGAGGSHGGCGARAHAPASAQRPAAEAPGRDRGAAAAHVARGLFVFQHRPRVALRVA